MRRQFVADAAEEPSAAPTTTQELAIALSPASKRAQARWSPLGSVLDTADWRLPGPVRRWKAPPLEDGVPPGLSHVKAALGFDPVPRVSLDDPMKRRSPRPAVIHLRSATFTPALTAHRRRYRHYYPMHGSSARWNPPGDGSMSTNAPMLGGTWRERDPSEIDLSLTALTHEGHRP